MRPAAIGIAAGIVLCSSILPAAAQSTTRIESRPFYGAAITVEEGVRVFRPLPSHDRVIINPNNAAAINVEVGAPTRGYVVPVKPTK